MFKEVVKINNDILIKKIIRDCPICDKVHKVEMRKGITQGLVKGVVFEYEEVYFLCPYGEIDGSNTWVSAGMMDENLDRARDAYQKIKNTQG